MSVCVDRFEEKTKNNWEHRLNFEKVPGKYDMVFMDYSTSSKVRTADTNSGDLTMAGSLKGKERLKHGFS